MSGVQVLADGNPRQGGMDEDERDQCIHGSSCAPLTLLFSHELVHG